MDTPDFIPDEQMQVLEPKSAPMVQAQHQETPEFIPDDQFESDEDKYGSFSQQALTAAEGAGQGLAGPLAPMAEKALGVKEEDILGRQKENPVSHGVGEAAGLGAGLLTGTGEAALMTKAGEAALELTGLANLAKEASLARRVGASAVQQAAEMAVLTSGDETSKLILHDPEASAETAIANVGMAAALGGAGGAFMTGAVSPLWKATAGPKVDQFLNGLTNHLNGTTRVLPGETQAAIDKLGVEVPDELRAVFSGDKAAYDKYVALKEVQNRSILEGIDKLNKDTSESVMKGLGLDPVDVEVYSENEAGHKLLDTFKNEYKEKYEPIAEKLNKRNTEAAGISVGDEAKLDTYGKLLENAMEKVGTDSPYYKLYEEYGNRMLAKDTIGQMDMLKTEINNRIKGLKVGGDYNTINALNDIKSTIADFQEAQIGKAALRSEAEGITGAASEGRNLLNERAETNRQYAEFSKLSNELTNHLGVGNFHGFGSLGSKLSDKISPEELLKKFSFRNNADFIKFLGENFPETLKEVQQNELKKLLKPAILSSKGDMPINVKKLSDMVSKAMSGQKEYVESVLPVGALDRINAARMLQDSIPNPKSSGTAGMMSKVFSKMPQSALAGVAMIVGHNPVLGYLSGEMSQMLGRHAPDAINLAYLKFLGSNQPIKAEGFKAMVEFFHNTYKGNNLIGKGIENVFKAGSQVLISSQMPSKEDLTKLDKIVDKLQDSPNKAYALQDGHVGHYLPNHQMGLSEVSMRALGYLQSIKPRPFKPGPLDSEVPPSQAEMARYNRALEIAQQPAIILKHIKDGTIQSSDMQDLGAMYPGLYKTMANKLSDKTVNQVGDEEPIPYKTKMGLSLFLGQPLDLSMTPMSINQAQAAFAPKLNPQGPGQGETKKGTSALGKNTKSYQTPLQASETRKMAHK